MAGTSPAMTERLAGLSRRNFWIVDLLQRRKHAVCMSGGWVYMMTNSPNGTLYTGVTSNLSRRVWEHREGLIEGFTRRYGLKRLVYTERYEDIRDAIQREKNVKHWPRRWKVRLILDHNPEWEDLYDTLA